MLLGFLELQQKWGPVEEGEAGWSLWRHPCPGGLLALTSPSQMLTEKGSSLTRAAACALSQGPCVAGCQPAGPQKGSVGCCGGDCVVTARCRR